MHPKIPIQLNKMLGNYFILLLAVMLFVPKIGLFDIPGFTVTVKPEDILWISALPILLFNRIDLSIGVTSIFLIFLLYLLISCIWFPSNLLLASRMYFYSIPLLYSLNLDSKHSNHVYQLIKIFLYLFAIVAILQVTIPFPGFNSGLFYFEQAGRAPGIFTNGVEFALVAHFGFWLAFFLGRRSFILWMAALIITLMAGTRFVSFIHILIALVYLEKPNFSKQVLIKAGTTLAILVCVAFYLTTSSASRWEGISAPNVISSTNDLISSLVPSDYVSPAKGYCFEFDNSLATDQSLAMRLSKLQFVMNTVVLGENILGFGLGKCTGDSGDDLYVRILADGGIPFLVIFIFFILSLIWLPIKDKTLRKNWRIFIFAFLALSFFYDTLYISRSAPLVFAIFAVVIGKTRPKLTQSSVTKSNDYSENAITISDSGNYSQSLPKVAVCLAAYNGSNWLDEQINSIFAQSGVDITLFVSIDSSSDDTEKIINLRAMSDTRIKVLPSGAHFGGAARNFFRLLHEVDFSDFDYVSLADQDDIWFPDKLSRAHEMIIKNKTDAYSSNVIAFWPSGKKELINKSQSQKSWDFLFEGAGPGCTFVMKPSLVKAIQDLLKKHWSDMQNVWMHDWFIYAFARANGYYWFIDAHAGMLYRQHGKNEVGANKGISAMIYRVQKVLKGDWGLSQVSLMAKLIGLANDKFIQIWIKGDRKGMLRLALHARQCRRHPSDMILFFIFCLLMAARP